MSHVIDCIIKPHVYSTVEHITEVGGRFANGTPFRVSVEQMIDWIDKGHEFWVERGLLRTKVVVVRPIMMRPYIRTVADNTVVDNLLSLNQCGFVPLAPRGLLAGM